jgi:hypothetical protein
LRFGTKLLCLTIFGTFLLKQVLFELLGLRLIGSGVGACGQFLFLLHALGTGRNYWRSVSLQRDYSDLKLEMVWRYFFGWTIGILLDTCWTDLAIGPSMILVFPLMLSCQILLGMKIGFGLQLDLRLLLKYRVAFRIFSLGEMIFLFGIPGMVSTPVQKLGRS